MQTAHSTDRRADRLDSPYLYDPPQFPPSVDRLTSCRIDISRAFEDTSHALPFLPSKTMPLRGLSSQLCFAARETWSFHRSSRRPGPSACLRKPVGATVNISFSDRRYWQPPDN